MHRTRTALAGLGVATALLVAGCGSNQGGVAPLAGSPKHQIQTAVQNLVAGDTLTAHLHLGADAHDLLTFASRVGGGGLNSQQAAAVAGVELTMTVHSTQGSLKDLSTASKATADKAGQLDLTLSDQGQRYAELRVVDTNLYLQADVHGLMTVFGAPANAYAKALQSVKQAPPFVTDLLQGKWVELPGSQLTSFANRLRQEAGPSAFPTPNAAQGKQFLHGLITALGKDVTVRSRGNDHYTLTANVRRVVGSFVSSFTQVEPALRGQLSQLPMSQVPNRTITFQATTDSGKLSQLSFDFAQLTTQSGVPHLPLDLDFDTASATVEAPSGTTTINLEQLFNELLQPSSVSGGSSSATLTVPASPLTGTNG